ncbi:MAG: hypothetical protein NTW16_00590 [Bacteroidetes bacterium]|nr:hypothetical protein [Bacteroidota bacterium]
MKKSPRILFFSLFLLGFMTFVQLGLAQAPPPPPVDKGTNSNKGPGGAPIDGGVIVALAMVAGYGTWKLLKTIQKKKQSVGN